MASVTEAPSSAADHDDTAKGEATTSSVVKAGHTGLVNASGHVQELARNFHLLSLAGVGLVVGNVWPPIGGSILVAIFNGGPPGVLYEFIAVSVFYWTVAASIAELASAIPSSAGVYHWATATPGPRWGRVIGFFAGWWNFLAWILGAASMAAIFGNTVVQMYALNHAGFAAQPWHVFVVYIVATWLACAAVCLANRAMPLLNNFGVAAILVGFLATVAVVAAMPGRGGRPPHASSSFVWTEWTADVGYPDGLVFVAGMLNGAFSVGAVDATTHLAEEIPLPHVNMPRAIGLQMSIGFVTGLCYLVAVMYAINDYAALFSSPSPIAEIYLQATGGSAAAATGLAGAGDGVHRAHRRGAVHNLRAHAVGAGARRGGALPGGAGPRARGAGRRARVADGGVGGAGDGAGVPLRGQHDGLRRLRRQLRPDVVGLLPGRRAAEPAPGPRARRRLRALPPAWLARLRRQRRRLRLHARVVRRLLLPLRPADRRRASMNYSCLIWGGLTLLVGLWWLLRARHGYEGPSTTGGVISEAERMAGPVEDLGNDADARSAV